MNILIEKRTRALVTDDWGQWLSTTDAAPYQDTDLIQYRVVDEYTVTLEELTNGSLTNNEWTGTGVFDVLIAATNKNIEGQFNLGRITGADYAKVYLGSMQAVLAQSVQFLLQRKPTEAQLDLLRAQTATEEKKTDLVARQTKGFDDDAKQKLLKQTLDSWSVAYSVAQDANSIPDTIKVNVIDSVMKNAMDNLLITKTSNPLGEI